MNYKLSEIALINPKESLPSGSLAKKVAMEKLQPFCRDIDGFELTKYNGGTKFRNGDTIMARITPCLENGKIAKVNILDEKEIGFGSTEYIIFRAKPGVTDEDFLYYLITSPIVRNPAIKSMVGSSGRQRVQTDVIQNLEIDVPELPIQKKIGSILKRIDDKIELNRKINDNLHKQCSCLYDQLVEKAESGKLEDIIFAIETGSRPKGGAEKSGIPSIGAEKIDKFGSYDYSTEKYINHEYFAKLKRGKIESGDVMLYKDGAYTGKSSMCLDGFPHEKAAVNEHVFLIRSKNKQMQSFLYFSLQNDKIHQSIYALACGKAAQPGLNQQELLSVDCPIPAFDDILAFEKKVKPIMHQIALNALQNRDLAKLRDSLLPKLMSGEIDVDSIEL